MDYTGASGAIPRDDYDRMDEHAERYYEEIRNRMSDVETIARNTGFSDDAIKEVKNHVFVNKYDLGFKEPRRFSPDYDIAVSWQRLIDGKRIQEMDIVLLNHEFMESRLMNEQGMSYQAAHDVTEKIYNYTYYIKELNRKAGLL